MWQYRRGDGRSITTPLDLSKVEEDSYVGRLDIGVLGEIFADLFSCYASR